MPTFELEDVHGNKYNETTRKHLPARLTNECEAKFNATVQKTRKGETAESNNVMQARQEIKNRVIEWLNEKDFENDLGPDKISPPSQEKILKEYQDYLAGIKYKDEKGGQGNSDGSGQE